MKNSIDHLKLPEEERQVDIIHVLNNGKVVLSKEFEGLDAENNEKYAWVNYNSIVDLVTKLRLQTDPNRKSIIALFENGDLKTFVNVSLNFTNYAILNKQSL